MCQPMQISTQKVTLTVPCTKYVIWLIHYSTLEVKTSCKLIENTCTYLIKIIDFFYQNLYYQIILYYLVDSLFKIYQSTSYKNLYTYKTLISCLHLLATLNTAISPEVLWGVPKWTPDTRSNVSVQLN